MVQQRRLDPIIECGRGQIHKIERVQRFPSRLFLIFYQTFALGIRWEVAEYQNKQLFEHFTD